MASRSNGSKLGNSSNTKLLKSTTSLSTSKVGDNPSKLRNTNEFSKQFQSLKQTEEPVEDEYIKNLQQTISYMELELKLLKEKELEQKQSVSQSDKFFNDGVPLNENILALKNQYTSSKKDSEQKMDEINEARMEEQQLNIQLTNEYKFYITRLAELEKLFEEKQKEHLKTVSELEFNTIVERNLKDEKELELKKLQADIKKKNDENLEMTRGLEKTSITIAHEIEMRKQKREKRLKILQDKDDLITKFTQEVAELKSKSTFNPDVQKIENENLDLQARIIQCEREINMATTKVKEMDMLMEVRAKERQVEAEQRRELTQRITQTKTKIDEENKANEMVIIEKVKVKEEKEKKEIEKQIDAKQKDKHAAEDRKQRIEDEIQSMIHEKVGIQQDVLDHEQAIAKLQKDTKDMKGKVSLLKAQIEHYIKINKDLEGRLKPLNDGNVTMDRRIQQLLPQIDKLRESIDILLTQAKLSSELKAVNLEELKLLHRSNDQVYHTLSELTKKWENIQKFKGP